jgi:hypothetical protein
MVLVFSRGKWLNIALPHVVDRMWSPQHNFIYATVAQQFVVKGFSEARAAQLAEAYVYKQICPGLKYDRALEQELILEETA